MNDTQHDHESLVLTVSLHGAASYKVDITFNEDRTAVDTRVVPIGKAVTSGLAQVVLDGMEFGSAEYQRRALAADGAIQAVITGALKQLAQALMSLRDAPSHTEDNSVVHLNSLTPGPDDTVN